MQLNTVFRFAFVRAPSDTSPAWQLRIELSEEDPERVFISLHWAGKDNPTYYVEETLSDLESMVKKMREESDAYIHARTKK